MVTEIITCGVTIPVAGQKLHEDLMLALQKKMPDERVIDELRHQDFVLLNRETMVGGQELNKFTAMTNDYQATIVVSSSKKWMYWDVTILNLKKGEILDA